MQIRSGAERRRGVRYSTAIPVRFCSQLLAFDSQISFFNGVVGDASTNGVFLRSDFLEPPGTKVQIQLWDDRPLTGEVMWVAEAPPKGPGMGIRLSENPLTRLSVATKPD